MEKDLGNFPLCGGCSRKERREGLKDGEFYCAIVEPFTIPDINAIFALRYKFHKSTKDKHIAQV